MFEERHVHLLIWSAFLSIVIFFAYTAADVYAKPRETIPPIAYKLRSDLIRASRHIWGISAPSATFGAQVHMESGWNPNVCNRIGACGLGQFMKPTASYMSRRYKDLYPAAPLSPTWAMLALARYNYENFKLAGDGKLTCAQARRVLASYNAGPGVLKRKTWPRETQRYVQRILYDLEPLYESAGWGLGSMCNQKEGT
jgi:soluble lytic murein transglycosylase-like protein